MAKRNELIERDALGFLIDQGRALANVPKLTVSETNLSFVLRNITAAKAWPVIAKWITGDSPGELFVHAFSYGYLSGFLDAEAGERVEAGSGPKGRRGTPGSFRKAITEVARKAKTTDPDQVLNDLEDEDTVEDLYGATGRERIDLHCFEVNREKKTISFSDRQGQEHSRSLKTMENILRNLKR